MTDDEREAAGLLRMLDVSGDDAFSFLQDAGMEVPNAVDLILKIVRLNRQEALRAMPPFLTAGQKEELLGKTHGRGPMPPACVLVYNDLVEQNLAVSVVANWDFRKAKSIQEQKSGGRTGIAGAILGKSAGKSYVQDLIQISGKWLKYTPVSTVFQKNGSILSFANGLRVDLGKKEAMIFIPSKGVQGAPASLFFFEQEKLVEKIATGDVLDASALVFEDQGTFYSVIADARLIRSMLFRLYYLSGESLSMFRLLLSRGTLQDGTLVRVFELEREKLPN